MRKPEFVVVGGRAVRVLPARSAPSAPVAELTIDDVHKACHGVAVEPFEGGYRVTTTAGSVCGDTLENALAGALRKYEEES